MGIYVYNRVKILTTNNIDLIKRQIKQNILVYIVCNTSGIYDSNIKFKYSTATLGVAV